MGKIRKKDIAIIGFAFKLPGGEDPESFWSILLSERACIRSAPQGRRHRNDPSFAQTDGLLAGFLEDIDRFDAAYFNISPPEAAVMDPRQRLFLETAVTAADIAGYGGEKLWGSDTGVFAGASAPIAPHPSAAQTEFWENGTHHADAMIANRVSHYMNLQGPSKTIDTLCSSTLAAIDEACRSLRSAECRTALAGGVHLISSAYHIAVLRKMNLLSPSGRCKTFDETADGFVLGEGVGVFLLKPLGAALADGDFIWGVIKGTAVNHSGRTDNILMPDAGAVARVVEAACRDAGIKPEAVTFMETNGTGAPLGDAIEFQGLKQAFQISSHKKHFCGLGAVKTRIGNLEAASGVGALVKVLLSMKYEKIPNNLHFKKINPLIQITDSPFYLCNEVVDWKPASFPRRAGINACGIGGANCHLIIETPPTNRPIRPKQDGTLPRLLCLSAQTPAALKALCGQYLVRIESQTDLNIPDLCATQNTGRTHFLFGLAVVFRNRMELTAALRQISSSGKDQWGGLKNVFFNKEDMAHIARRPAEKSGVLAKLRQHYRAETVSRKFWSRRPGRTVFLTGDAQTAQTLTTRYREAVVLKNRGIVPDRVLGLKKGARVAWALAAGSTDSESVRDCLDLKKPGIDESPDAFFAALKAVSSDGSCIFINLGLSAKDVACAAPYLNGGHVIPWPRAKGDEAALVRLVAELYALGGPVDFAAFYGETFFQKTVLPPYPFERKFYPGRPAIDVAVSQPDEFAFLDAVLHELHSGLSEAEVENLMAEMLNQVLVRIAGYHTSDIDPDRTFSDYGINSIITTQLIGILESRFGFQIGPSVFSRYDTIRTLAAFLADGCTTFRQSQRADPWPGEPVVLVEAGREHLADVLRWFNDPRTTQWLDPFFQTDFDAKAFGFFLSKRDKKTYIIRSHSAPVGICGLIDVDPRNLSAETWLVIGEPWARAAGVAAAAGSALCERAFRELKLKTLTGKVRIDNDPALSLMHYTGWEKVGLLKDSLWLGGRFYDRCLFQITRGDFKRWRECRTVL
ncbi:MAG: GNAT family N-acetyltransferase [bacterium]|nr:GNAT family N-acetyltransferase [bacterium]